MVSSVLEEFYKVVNNGLYKHEKRVLRISQCQSLDEGTFTRHWDCKGIDTAAPGSMDPSVSLRHHAVWSATSYEDKMGSVKDLSLYNHKLRECDVYYSELYVITFHLLVCTYICWSEILLNLVSNLTIARIPRRSVAGGIAESWICV